MLNIPKKITFQTVFTKADQFTKKIADCSYRYKYITFEIKFVPGLECYLIETTKWVEI